jgi:hypothetical protein
MRYSLIWFIVRKGITALAFHLQEDERKEKKRKGTKEQRKLKKYRENEKSKVCFFRKIKVYSYIKCT